MSLSRINTSFAVMRFTAKAAAKFNAQQAIRHSHQHKPAGLNRILGEPTQHAVGRLPSHRTASGN
jgi:hypothetical protein